MYHQKPSEARRLTDILRSASDQSPPHEQKGAVDERNATLQMVLEGAVLRQRFLADGRRHTIAVYYRDDVINLMGYSGLRQHDSDYLLALEGTVVGYVPDDAVHEMQAKAPGHYGIGALACRELGIARESMIRIGQRTALEAMAHFFCETLIRCARPAGNFRTERCPLHMTQEMLSSVLALSTVHVNRTLQRLRRLGLADVINHELLVHDYERLAALADFNEDYLAPL